MFLQKLRKSEDAIIPSVDKRFIEYIRTTENIVCDLKRFQDFLYRNFHEHKGYEVMPPRSNHPGCFFTTSKTQKFELIEDVSLDYLKLRPINEQTRTDIFKAFKAVAKYLNPFSMNVFSIIGTLIFLELLKDSSNNESYEDVSYDIESLFANISVQETKDFIPHRICACKEIQYLKSCY